MGAVAWSSPANQAEPDSEANTKEEACACKASKVTTDRNVQTAICSTDEKKEILKIDDGVKLSADLKKAEKKVDNTTATSSNTRTIEPEDEDEEEEEDAYEVVTEESITSMHDITSECTISKEQSGSCTVEISTLLDRDVTRTISECPEDSLSEGKDDEEEEEEEDAETRERKERKRGEMEDFKRELAVKRGERQKAIASIAEEMRNLRKVSEELESEKEERKRLEAHVTALKDVAKISKEMLRIREIQVTDLKAKVETLESSILGDSNELQIEYEKQMENIRCLRQLYDERSTALATEHQREIEKERAKTEVLEIKIRELENAAKDKDEKLEELQGEIKKLKEESERKNGEFAELKEDATSFRFENKTLSSQMSLINNLFSHLLTEPELDFDKLTNLLQENHNLINDLTVKGDINDTAALLVHIYRQSDETQAENASASSTQKETSTQDITQAQQVIASNLPKVWRVLLELLSHYVAPIAVPLDGGDKTNGGGCYKDVETPYGTRSVISVSQTFLRLKDLILEKNSLVTEVGRLKTLNGHLESRLDNQEKRLAVVSNELHKTWGVVSKLRLQHKQLHTSEQILRYELQHKRLMLNELKEELEYCRIKWDEARQKNSQSEEDWLELRKEFAARKIRQTSNSAESGYDEDDSTPMEETSESPSEDADEIDLPIDDIEDDCLIADSIPPALLDGAADNLIGKTSNEGIHLTTEMKVSANTGVDDGDLTTELQTSEKASAILESSSSENDILTTKLQASEKNLAATAIGIIEDLPIKLQGSENSSSVPNSGPNEDDNLITKLEVGRKASAATEIDLVGVDKSLTLPLQTCVNASTATEIGPSKDGSDLPTQLKGIENASLATEDDPSVDNSYLTTKVEASENASSATEKSLTEDVGETMTKLLANEKGGTDSFKKEETYCNDTEIKVTRIPFFGSTSEIGHVPSESCSETLVAKIAGKVEEESGKYGNSNEAELASKPGAVKTSAEKSVALCTRERENETKANSADSTSTDAEQTSRTVESDEINAPLQGDLKLASPIGEAEENIESETTQDPVRNDATKGEETKSCEGMLDARALRLKRLEEQCTSLLSKMNRTSKRGDSISDKLEQLHIQYGSTETEMGSSQGDGVERTKTPSACRARLQRVKKHSESTSSGGGSNADPQETEDVCNFSHHSSPPTVAEKNIIKKTPVTVIGSSDPVSTTEVSEQRVDEYSRDVPVPADHANISGGRSESSAGPVGSSDGSITDRESTNNVISKESFVDIKRISKDPQRTASDLVSTEVVDTYDVVVKRVDEFSKDVPVTADQTKTAQGISESFAGPAGSSDGLIADGNKTNVISKEAITEVETSSKDFQRDGKPGDIPDGLVVSSEDIFKRDMGSFNETVRNTNERLENRALRLNILENQCRTLFKRVSITTHKREALSNRLEELHEHYGSGENLSPVEIVPSIDENRSDIPDISSSNLTPITVPSTDVPGSSTDSIPSSTSLSSEDVEKNKEEHIKSSSAETPPTLQTSGLPVKRAS